MNARVILLAVLAIGGGLLITAFPMLTPYIILLMAWRAYLLLNPEKPKQEAAALMRSATMVVTLCIVGFVVILMVLISLTPDSPSVAFFNYNSTTNSSPRVSTVYYFPGNPLSAVAYSLMGRSDAFAASTRGPSYIIFSPAQPVFAAEPEVTAEPEATPESLG